MTPPTKTGRPGGTQPFGQSPGSCVEPERCTLTAAPTQSEQAPGDRSVPQWPRVKRRPCLGLLARYVFLFQELLEGIYRRLAGHQLGLVLLQIAGLQLDDPAGSIGIVIHQTGVVRHRAVCGDDLAGNRRRHRPHPLTALDSTDTPSKFDLPPA